MGGVPTRGVIQNEARKRQINDFRDLRFGNITPTDIDAVIEYHGKAYAYLEIKYGDAELPYGQRLYLERQVQDNARAGKQAIAAVVEHNIHNTEVSVPVAECPVRSIYLSKEMKWRNPLRNISVLEMLTEFFRYVDSAGSAEQAAKSREADS